MQHTAGKTTPHKTGQENENEHIEAAHKEAEKDIGQDPDLSSEPDPADDLDEGELARLEGEE
ncbi:MAG: hypothetical protein ABI416_04995 [Ginsengibacter sp.]